MVRFMRNLQKRRKKRSTSRRYKSFIDKINKVLEERMSLVNNTDNASLTYQIPQWRDLTKMQKLAYKMYFMDTSEMSAITVDFSHVLRDKYLPLNYAQVKAAVGKRLRENLKNALGYIPLYVFVVEDKNNMLHIHGIMNIPLHEKDRVKHALKVSACGVGYKDSPMNNRIIKIKPLTRPRGWLAYMNKTLTSARSLYISQPFLRKIRADYMHLYDMNH